jgi:hypothetical protein
LTLDTRNTLLNKSKAVVIELDFSVGAGEGGPRQSGVQTMGLAMITSNSKNNIFKYSAFILWIDDL